MNKININSKKFRNFNLTLTLILSCFIFGIQPAYAAITYGDVSQDNYVTAYDSALTAQYSVSLTSLTADQLTAADVSGDTQITAFDAALIAQYAVGLINIFPVEDKILRPGDGFTEPTPQPPAIGNPGDAGFDAKAIARWDVVPYQTFDSTFNVGVVAFHINGIDRVEFSVNNGPWLAVREMTLNPQTANHSGIGNQSDGVVEYWATLDASRFSADGPIEVRAIAYPKVGVPRVLESMSFYANGHNTLPQVIRYVATTGNDTTGDGSEAAPFATIYRAARSMEAVNGGRSDNGLIYLKAGDYNWAGANNGWPEAKTVNVFLTVTSAPGLTRDQVRLTSSSARDALNAPLVHLKNLTVYKTSLVCRSGVGYSLWVDACVLSADSPADDPLVAPMSWWNGGVYYTDTEFRNIANATNGFTLGRNLNVHDIGEDAFRGVGLLINSTAANIRAPEGTTFHSDVIQDMAASNGIVYGLIATTNISAQGVSANGPKEDTAIINVVMTTQMINLQMEFAHRHMLIKDGIFGSSCLWRTDWSPPRMFSAVDVVVDNCGNAFGGAVVPGVTYR